MTAIPTEEAPEPLQSAKYLYDGDGNLVKSVVNSTLGHTTTTYYPGKHYNVEEKNDNLKVQKHYAAGSTVIAVRTITADADTLQWMISDHLGSTSTTVNADGTWNSDIRYTAFGEIRLKTGVTATGYRYTGQLDMQGSIGLDYYVARFYDPQLARFAQADTIIPNAGSIKSFDHYAYVNNNPIIYNDPTGHDVGCAGRDASACDSMNHLRPSSWWEAALNWGKTTLAYYFVNVVYPQNKAAAQVVRNSFTILPLLQTPVISQTLGNWMGVGNGQAPGPIAPIVPVNQTQMIQSLLQYDRTQLTGQGLEVLTGDPAVAAINNNIRQFTQNDPRYGKENFSYKYTTESDNFNSPMPGNQIVFGGSDRGSAFSQPGTWEVRNASYSAQVDVTKNGVITVNYQIEDIFDLRPGGRGLVYDAIGAVAAPIYHDFLGGNPNMKTIVNWVWVYTP